VKIVRISIFIWFALAVVVPVNSYGQAVEKKSGKVVKKPQSRDLDKSYLRLINAVHVPGDLTVAINGVERRNPYGLGATMLSMGTTAESASFSGDHPESKSAQKAVKLPKGKVTTVFYYADVKRNDEGKVVSSTTKIDSISQSADVSDKSTLTIVSLSEAPLLTLTLSGSKAISLPRLKPVTVPMTGAFSLTKGEHTVISAEVGDRGSALVFVYNTSSGKLGASVFE